MTVSAHLEHMTLQFSSDMQSQKVNTASDMGVLKQRSRDGAGKTTQMDQAALGGIVSRRAKSIRAEESDERLMMELTELVQRVVKDSSWWEKRGIDCAIVASAFLCLPAGFLLLGTASPFFLLMGLLVMGTIHAVITVKGSHLASHRALSSSKAWTEFWNIFFTEVCGSFSAKAGVDAHVKLHHAHTNIIGLGDSSTWKLPFLPRYIYLFMAPLAVPIITPIVAVGLLKDYSPGLALRTICTILLGLGAHYWLLVHVSGFQSVSSTLLCMMSCRAVFSLPYIHVNIFQHIGLAMFSPLQRPKRIHQMTHGVLNLPRNPVLDWMFGHSLISCHVEHHLFPYLSDHMCLKVKPIVSRFLKYNGLPYQEDAYLSRLRLFIQKYEELMVFAPPITELVGIQ